MRISGTRLRPDPPLVNVVVPSTDLENHLILLLHLQLLLLVVGTHLYLALLQPLHIVLLVQLRLLGSVLLFVETIIAAQSEVFLQVGLRLAIIRQLATVNTAYILADRKSVV